MQKNIVYGSITAGGNVHIGDKIYLIERDYSQILFLRIEKGTADYEAMLWVKSQEGTPQALFKEKVQLPVPQELFNQADDLLHRRRGTHPAPRRGAVVVDSPQVSEQVLSETLYQTFFSGDIGQVCRDFLDLLQAHKIKDLLLVISTEEERIQNLPWEVVLPKFALSGDPNLPKNNFGIIRSREKTLDSFNLQGPIAEAAPLKMLFIPALPENLPDRSKMLEIEDEQRRIIEAVRKLEATGNKQPKLVMEILDCANLEEIVEALRLRSHDIVHISGHGAFVDATKQGILYLEDEEGDELQMEGRELGLALRDFSSIKVVVLNACETAVGGSQGSTAEQIAATGLPAVLAMRYSVTDQAARLFTETFYERLAYGDTLTKAMHDARQVLWQFVHQRRKEAPQVITPAEWVKAVLYHNQWIGSLIKTDSYQQQTHDRFYPQEVFIKGKHTRLIGKGFIGRKRILIQLRQYFRQNQHVCLHGQGGLGKTTTAEAFADLY
ncbi:MAG: CHAT domain-containing protein, partial [Cytophagaceae bacterium]|nr:CHAT domain-containing protein [Cytophagaceae bacterium]